MKIIVYLNFVLTLILIGAFIWLLNFQRPQSVPSENTTTYVDQCGDDCQKQIDKSVEAALVTTSASAVSMSPRPSEGQGSVVAIITTKPKPQTAYLPIGGPISTTSTDWYNAPGTEFYLNYNSDYGTSAYANWEAFLKVAHGNGTVYARLYDVTNKIAVNGSEVNVVNSSDLSQVISGRLNFWAGNNLYRVQIKSLNTFEVTFGSGRVKIIY